MPAIVSHLKIQLEPSPSTTEGFSFPLFDRGMRGMIRTCDVLARTDDVLDVAADGFLDSRFVEPRGRCHPNFVPAAGELGYLSLPHSRKVVDDQRRQRYRPSVGGGEGIFDPPVDRPKERK